MLRGVVAAALLTLAPGTALGLCGTFPVAEKAPPFTFIVSKADQVRDKDLKTGTDDEGMVLNSRVSEATPVEARGDKRSQRSEVRETPESSAITEDGGWVCYSFEIEIADDTALPRDSDGNGNRAKLTIAQFHQDPTPGHDDVAPALFLNLSPDGALQAVFGDAVGAREAEILPAGDDVFDTWWRITVAARWSMDDLGRVAIWIGQPGKEPRLALYDRGRNTTTGHVYQKLGAYRSFIERDPGFAEEQVKVRYRNISRNGDAAELLDDG